MLESLFIAHSISRIHGHSENNTASQTARRVATDVRTRSESIQFDVERLFMLTEALWRILKEEHGYNDDLLVQKIQEVDLQDGVLDGKVAKSSERPACPQCGRTAIKNQHACLYCGASVAQHPFER